MSRPQTDQARPGDTLLVIHDFTARSPDELTMKRGDRIQLIERDDDFGDGWFLGRHQQNGLTGLFPEVYTQLAPRTGFSPVFRSKPNAHPAADSSKDLPPPPADEATNAGLERQQTSSSLADSLDTGPNDSTGQSNPPTISAIGQATAGANTQASLPSAGHRGLIPGDQRSPVMNETLNVIDEHLTDINTPRGTSHERSLRFGGDSSSEYSSSHVDHRLSYINGHETDEEEQGLYTLFEVRAWTPARVAEWLEDEGVDTRQCNVFKEQEISGEVLLGMDQQTLLMKEFDLGPIGPRLKIWQKIRSLQEEVAELARNSQAFTDGSSSSRRPSDTRHRSTSIGTVLPRIPSLMESNGARPSSKQRHSRQSSSQHSKKASDTAPAPGTPSSSQAQHSRRPSAASVRDLNHSRRHSSIDFAAGGSTPKTAGPVKVTVPTPQSHKKQGSFDQGWSMGDQLNGGARPDTTESSPRESALKVITPDLDRGYFSGGELDNRKQKNVLRKAPSSSHSRESSFSHEGGRRLSTFRRHSRIGSSDSIRDYTEAALSGKSFFPSNRAKNSRTASGPELRHGPKPIKERANIVTKLDYGTPSIDAVASSPNLLEGSDQSSQGRASPPPAIQRYPKEQRATGLRAISDALAGTLSGARKPPPSPVKDSPLNSPVRTTSSGTPSHGSKSLDGEPAPDVLRQGTSASMPSTTSGAAPRRKSKKETSAYQRGLEQKPPSEQIKGCDYSGWMKKRSSNLMTTWKTRLFVLRGRRLSYYYAEDDIAERGLIDISGHRVLPANDERITGLHAAMTGAKSSPSSPLNASIPTSASTGEGKDDTSGMFIFKLVPPRSGLSKAVNFTKPTVHYFAVDSLQQGRDWMAALVKATIDRDDSKEVISTYQQKTISLSKARAMQQRPPALMAGEEGSEENGINPSRIDEVDEDPQKGLAISGLEGKNGENDHPEGVDRNNSVGGSDTTQAQGSSFATASAGSESAENKE
ncbi:polarized growth protein Boi2 [Phyllosticta citribraziliensis]|uniref:Polarized growth protein Boi2 n=1 Tax=Phyllosticta citribraziliensis TaxID=989973 RepID=A0ABR1M0J2_9PEZI